jgi:hypothetical protein
MTLGLEGAWLPIAKAARDGTGVLVMDLHGNYAKAWWTGDMWALDAGNRISMIEQLSFEPTHYQRRA